MMKSLLLNLLLLPLIAVIAVNGLYFPEKGKDHLELGLRNSVNTTTVEPSGDCESNGGECKKNKKKCKDTISMEYTCQKKGVCCIVEVKAQDTLELMLHMINRTMLDLKQTVEILNSNLSNAISDQGKALHINQDNIMSNLSDAISYQGVALQINQNNIMSNLTGGFSNEKNMLESIEDNIMSDLSDGFSNQEDMLEIIEGNQDIILSKLTRIEKKQCSEGFFVEPHHCFKLYTDTRRSWTSAKSKCESEGLRMAEIDNPTPLMDTLVTTLGVNYYTWLGAKGDGSSIRWQSDKRILSSSYYWYSSYDASSSNCVMILSNNLHQRTRPFYSWGCTNTAHTLCEYV